jgi:hypothetical protein
MEEYYRWQIEQLRATVAQQERIINQLITEKSLNYENKD